MSDKINKINWVTSTVGQTPFGDYLIGKAQLLLPNGIPVTIAGESLMGLDKNFLAVGVVNAQQLHALAQRDYDARHQLHADQSAIPLEDDAAAKTELQKVAPKAISKVAPKALAKTKAKAK